MAHCTLACHNGSGLHGHGVDSVLHFIYRMAHITLYLFLHRHRTRGIGGPWPPIFLVLREGVVRYLARARRCRLIDIAIVSCWYTWVRVRVWSSLAVVQM